VLADADDESRKIIDPLFLHRQDGLLDRDRVVFADEFIQVVGMSWDGRGAYQEWMHQKDDETAD
jgi:two-component system OmpR family response regulator